MKKLLLAVATIVLSSNVSAKGMGCENHEAPFLGTNTHKDKCCIVFNDADGFKTILSGDASVTSVVNKNHVISTCEIEIPENSEFTVVPGRNKVDNCRIGVKRMGERGMDHFNGLGGFTIDLDEGIASGNCKAVNELEI